MSNVVSELCAAKAAVASVVLPIVPAIVPFT